MDNEASQIRGAIAGLKRRRTERIPDSVRRAVRRYVSRRRRVGATWRELSAAVGLSTNTLQRFVARGGRAEAGGALVPVSVRPQPPRREEATGGLVLVTSHGMRLEGLGVAEAVELLRALS